MGASISRSVDSFKSNFVAVLIKKRACSLLNLPSAIKNLFKFSRFGFVGSSES